jgi:hypothetical protein
MNMALRIDMPQELEARLREKAQLMGVTVESLAVDLLAAGGTEHRPPRDGNELVEHWRIHGLIGYRPDISDPSKHAASLRTRVENGLTNFRSIEGLLPAQPYDR